MKNIAKKQKGDKKTKCLEQQHLIGGNGEKLEFTEHVSDYFHDEAEEDNQVESEEEYKEENILFEGGSMQSSNFNITKSKKNNGTVFDCYDVSSEDDTDSDLDGFIESDSDEELKKGSSIIEQTLKKIDKNIKKRRRIKSVEESDNESNSDLNETIINPTSTGRKRILSSSDEESNFITREIGKRRKLGYNNSKEVITNVIDGYNINFEHSEMNRLSSVNDNHKRYCDMSVKFRDNVKHTGKSECIFRTPTCAALQKLSPMSEDKENDSQLILKRRLKKVTNKLNEDTIQRVSKKVERLYKRNTLKNINKLMTMLLFDIIVDSDIVQDSIIENHALLISILSANVGCEVGGHILTEFVILWKEQFDKCHNRRRKRVQSKEQENLLSFISYFFVLCVVDSSLIFDILTYISQDFHCLQVKLMSHIMQKIGPSLKKSDWIYLNKFILNIETKDISQDEDIYYSTKHLLEVATSVRDNTFKTSDSDCKHLKQLKSIKRSCVHEGCYSSNLNVTLTTVIESNITGRWWEVKSSYSDDQKEQSKCCSSIEIKFPFENYTYTEKFMKKAKKLDFGIPPRLNIYYSLTEGYDNCVDCVQDIFQLNLNNSQTNEVFIVILSCCLREKLYNPYYAFITERLCKQDHKYKSTLKHTLWDKFNEIYNLKSHSVSNLSKFTAELVSKHAINMGVFQTLALNESDVNILKFVKPTLFQILMNSEVSNVEKAFMSLCRSSKLREVKREIFNFISKYMPVTVDDTHNKLLVARTKLALDILEKSG